MPPWEAYFFSQLVVWQLRASVGLSPRRVPRPRVSGTLLVLVFPLYFFLNQSSDISDTEGEAGGTQATEDTGLARPPGASSSTHGLRALHGGPGPQDCRTLGGIRPPGATVERISSVHASFLGRSSGRRPCM